LRRRYRSDSHQGNTDKLERAMLLRICGYLFLCAALAAAAYDGTRMIADKGELTFTSVLQHWEAWAPLSLAATREAVEGINFYLWSPLMMTVLVLPAWMVSGGAGILLYVAGYRRPRPALPDGI
jgi:hypothetical protein